MERKIIRIPVYFSFGLAAFLVALALSFPDERVKEIAVVQMEAQLGNRYDVTVDDLDLWWLTGVALEGITLSERFQPGAASPADDPSAEDDGPPLMRVEIPQVAARLSVLSSLINVAPTVDFNVDLGGGDLDGSYVHGGDGRLVEIDVNDVDLKQAALLSPLLGLPVFGTLDGAIVIELDAKRPLVTGGSIDLAGKQLTIGPGTITSDRLGAMGFIDVPQTNFGNLVADLDIAQAPDGTTRLNFEQLDITGRDVRGAIWGNIKLGRGAAGSRAKLEMRFQFDEQFITKNSLQSVLNLKWLREGKRQDWYGFLLWGSLAKPNFKGAPTATDGPPQADKPAPAAD